MESKASFLSWLIYFSSYHLVPQTSDHWKRQTQDEPLKELPRPEDLQVGYGSHDWCFERIADGGGGFIYFLFSSQKTWGFMIQFDSFLICPNGLGKNQLDCNFWRPSRWSSFIMESHGGLHWAAALDVLQSTKAAPKKGSEPTVRHRNEDFRIYTPSKLQQKLLKIDVWKNLFLLKWSVFRGYAIFFGGV